MKRKLLYCFLIIAAALAFNTPSVAQSIASGYYFIKSAYTHAAANSCIYDPRTTDYVKIQVSTNAKNQLFWISEFEEGKYRVQNAETGRYLIKFISGNGVLLANAPEDDVYTQFAPADNKDGIYHFKDNTQTNYYNWNGQNLNGGAGFNATYNYHDFTLEAASAELLEQLGIDGNTPPDDTEPEPEPEPMAITDGFYFIRSAYDSPYVGPNVVVYDPAEEDCIKNHNNGYEKQDIFLIKQFEEGKYTVQNLATARYVNKFEGTNNVTLVTTPEEGTWIEFTNVRADVFRWKDNHTNSFYNWNGNAINGGAGLSSTYNYHDWQLVPVSKDLLASFGIEGNDIPVITPPVDSVAYIDASWMSLGTSITWYNNNVSSAFTKGYQTRVREELPFKGFINRGVNASCIAGCDGQVGFANYYTIEHGINDWGHSTPVGTLEDYINNTKNGTFAASYRILIDKIYATNPNAMVILCTPRKGYGFGGYLPNNCNEAKNGIYLKDYAEIIRQIAEYESLPVADFFAFCGNQRNLAQLSIDQALHPNDLGYQLMADVLIKEFRKILLHPIVNPVVEDDF